MLHWNIITPEYTSYYGEYEPHETGRDVVTVEASCKRDALIAGVRKLRNDKSEWIHNQQLDNASPFSGLKAEIPVCEHGKCYCDICIHQKDWEPCAECVKFYGLEEDPN